MFTMPTINMVATGKNILRLREEAGPFMCACPRWLKVPPLSFSLSFVLLDLNGIIKMFVLWRDD